MIKGGGTGYELFDRTNFGMTEFQEKLDKTRATEGELQRTIDGLGSGRDRRACTSPRPMRRCIRQHASSRRRRRSPSRPKPAQSLSPQEVHGITMLVANAVDGLKPENVTIVNSRRSRFSFPARRTADRPTVARRTRLKMTQDQLLAKQRYES